jgi:hypothetical protein
MFSTAFSMTDVTFTFRVDSALKEAFTAMAEKQDLSAAQLLRTMMREAVEKHRQAAAHERWLQREIEDAMHETGKPRSASMSNEAIEAEWRRDQDHIRCRDEI